MQFRSSFESYESDVCRNFVFIWSLARCAAYYANLGDCARSNEGGVLSRLSRWWRLRIWRPSLSPFVAWAQPNLKSSAAVLYGFRLNKNARGQSSPELNSQNERLWNDRSWRKADAHNWTKRLISRPRIPRRIFTAVPGPEKPEAQSKFRRDRQ